jgi:nucleotidyltransferase/DNA polymerase involved in DNA repair
MLWIGKSTAELLRRHGIKTIGDMANKKNNQLVQKLLDKN